MSPAFGAPRLHLRVTDSTNDRARELVDAGAPSGTMVTAAEQTAGRGRTGRRWSAPAGVALLATAVLRPLEAAHRLLPLAVPLAVCEAIESVAPLACAVKWPNDIWIDERKVSGILIEARPPDWALIGIGINLAIPDDAYPQDLRWPATSVRHGVGADAMLAALCAALERWVDAPGADVLGGFRDRDALRGREVTWDGGEGVAAGIDDDGDLVVDTADGRATLGAGEVQLSL
jgi:BirA family transcriptional regulator, biotin operon repressor / biotin---[acetyl-CoA-carboxylase] ligase